MHITFDNDILVCIITVIMAVLCSSAFWAWWNRKRERRSASRRLILGVGFSFLIELCKDVEEQGYFEEMQYAAIFEYIWPAYKELGGDGMAEKYVNTVKSYPVRHKYDPKRLHKEEHVSDDSTAR